MKSKSRHFRRNIRAVSPVIAVLLMIVIAVAASLFAYAWTMGYLDFLTVKVDQGVQVQAINWDGVDTITAYAQNVGPSDVDIANVYVDDVLDLNAQVLDPATMTENWTLPSGETRMIVSTGIYTGADNQVTVKVTTADGNIFMLKKTVTSGGGVTPPPTYVYYKPITIGTVTGGPHTNFPVLISITANSDIAARAATGDQIYFTDDAGVLIPHELISYSAGSVSAWVSVPSLNTGTVIRIYYGTTRPSYTPTAVWDTNYKGVWHLEEAGTGTAGDYVDSTSNNNDGQGGGGTTNRVPAQASGQIGYGQDFEGTDSTPDFIDVGSASSLSITGSITLEAWVKVESWEYEYWHMIVARQYGTGSGDGYLLCANDGGTGYIIVGGNNANYGTLIPGSWYHIVGVASGSTRRVYINGVGGTTGSGVTWSLDANPVLIGAGENSGPGTFPDEQFDGIIDEVRISNTVRSAAWIQTEYSNMFNPVGFIGLGSEVQGVA